MSAAPELQILDSRPAAVREWDAVVVFEKATFGATPGRADECALAAIAPPHLALHVSRDVPARGAPG